MGKPLNLGRRHRGGDAPSIDIKYIDERAVNAGHHPGKSWLDFLLFTRKSTPNGGIQEQKAYSCFLTHIYVYLDRIQRDI